jgi:hypothetical protein
VLIAAQAGSTELTASTWGAFPLPSPNAWRSSPSLSGEQFERHACLPNALVRFAQKQAENRAVGEHGRFGVRPYSYFFVA